ncbi:hypothetical protein V6Z11_A10G014200 [Gossypium hirsutum]|uniref:Uncharacterized protein n=1 Tax=Gossypium darwinii TaxID=34276 RepID=A0A5D2EUN7_GOSDA|nr:hypothetical protein ES288_A10G014100v1 [Gossypium darwinii]
MFYDHHFKLKSFHGGFKWGCIIPQGEKRTISKLLRFFSRRQ